MRVFLQESVEVSRPFGEVQDHVASGGIWLAPLARAAEEDGAALYLRVGPSWAGAQATRKVRVTLGPPYNREETLVVPLSWRTTTLSKLFPVLEGDLEIAPLGPERCRLTLTASYEPPLGEFGHQLDKTLLHHIANSTVRAFLDRVADRLCDQDASVWDLRPNWD